MPANTYSETRFQFDSRRDVLWRTLCRASFSRFIRPDARVLDLGAGYAHFINHVQCAQRTAIDQWELLSNYTAPGVVARIGKVTELDLLADGSVDFGFASNVVVHLSQAELASLLEQLRGKLKKGGTLNVLQPNYRLAYREYFDDFTHVSIYSDVSLCDFLRAHGYRILLCKSGFLPFSIKSKFPVASWLIRLYLLLPWKPFAKQMFVRAEPEEA